MVDRQKVINFLQDFGCAKLEQLQILFDKPNYNFKSILINNVINKKGDIFVHSLKKINIKMISAIEVLCKFKKRLLNFHKGYDPVYITFLTNENVLYNIIVTDKSNENGVLKLLKTNSTSIPEADKFIILFEDKECFNKIECKTPCLYCVYPNIQIINKENYQE